MLCHRVVAMEGDGHDLTIFTGYNCDQTPALYYKRNEDPVEVEGRKEVEGEDFLNLSFSLLK